MNLFYLEDDFDLAIQFSDLAKQIGANVLIATTLEDAEYIMEIEPGVAAFDRFIFDLSVPYAARMREDTGLVEYGMTTGYAGLDFILDYYENDPVFKKAIEGERVAILSGHYVDALFAGEEYKMVLQNILCLSKLSSTIESEEFLAFLLAKNKITT